MESHAALEGTDLSRLQSNQLITLSILLLKYFSETQTTWGSVTDSSTKKGRKEMQNHSNDPRAVANSV